MPTYFSLNSENMKIYPVYLTTTGTYFSETETHRPSGFGEHQFHLTLEGEGIFEVDGRVLKAKPGTLLYIPPDIPHSYHRVKDSWTAHWLTFDSNNTDELFESVLPKKVEVIEVGLKDPIYTRMKDVNRLTSENYQNNAFKISAIIYNMIADFAQNIDSREGLSGGNNHSHVESAILFMEQNYARDISLEDLAEYVGISPQYLCRLFKKQLGFRPFEYLRQLRINKSKTLLLESRDKKIEDIAKEVGFNNPSYYGSIFRQYEDMTPKEFLKIHKR